MAENEFQESPPLSQETYLQLFKELDGMNGTTIHNDITFSMLNEPDNNSLVDLNNARPQVPMEVLRKWDAGLEIPPNQCIHAPSNLPEQMRPISSLPATEDWSGMYDFSIHFDAQKSTKGVSWIFSPERNKLYAAKDVCCPIKFATKTQMPRDVFIRAMALFSSSDHASEKVSRCINHSMEDIKNNIFEAEHLIRCESTSAIYENDAVTGRHSVIVPFENPPVGQTYSTYLYKFVCFGSCAGGPNRRPLVIVFTLEDHRGVVIGRRSVDLKICACPIRDYKLDNKQASELQLKEKPKPLKRSSAVLDNIPTWAKKPMIKDEKETEKCYCIKTKEKNCYNFLKKMKRVYDVYCFMKSRYPVLKNSILSSQSSSGEETDAL